MSRVLSFGSALAISVLSAVPALGEDTSARALAETGAGAQAPATAAKAPAPAGDAIKAKADLPPPPPRPSYVVVTRINLASQQMTVSVNGQHAHTWAVSSGRSEFPTPRGTFRAQWTSRMWYSRKYDLAPMPHAVFFSGGAAIHGTQSVGMLGRPASHGCVRLAPGNAATFFGLVQKHGIARTQVVVFGNPPAPAVARRETPRHREIAAARGRQPVHAAQAKGAYGYAYQPVAQPAYGYQYSQYSVWGAPIGQAQGNAQGYTQGYASSPRPASPRQIRLR